MGVSEDMEGEKMVGEEEDECMSTGKMEVEEGKQWEWRGTEGLGDSRGVKGLQACVGREPGY